MLQDKRTNSPIDKLESKQSGFIILANKHIDCSSFDDKKAFILTDKKLKTAKKKGKGMEL